MKVQAVFAVAGQGTEEAHFSVEDFAGAHQEATRGYGKVMLYLNSTSVPCSVAVYLGLVDEVSACAIIKYDGADVCLQSLLTALQYAPFWHIAGSMPAGVVRTLFMEMYGFDIPEHLDTSTKVLTRILDRMRALQSSVVPEFQDTKLAFSIDSVRAMLYSKSTEELYIQIRDVYKFHGSLAHLKDVPRSMLDELYFMVTRQCVTEESVLSLLQQIVITVGCTSDNIVRDPEVLQFGEHLQSVRLATGRSSVDFAELVGIPVEDYLMLERGDLVPTITDMTAILRAIAQCANT